MHHMPHNPMLPYFVAAEQLTTCLLVLVCLIAAAIAVCWSILWISERICYWGRSKTPSRQELAGIHRSQHERHPPVWDRQDRSGRVTIGRPDGNKLALARQFLYDLKHYFQPSCFSLWVKEPGDVSGLLKWLRTAQRLNKQLLVAVIHNRIGCLLANAGEFTEALLHFERARDVFDELYPEMTEAQATVLMLEQLAECGNREAAEELPRVREAAVTYKQFMQSHMLEVIMRNLQITRLRKEAPLGVEFYLRAAEASGSEEATAFLRRAVTEFEDRLTGKWYCWPIAAAVHDLIVAQVWTEGFDREDAERLQEALALAERHEVPFDGFRQRIRDTVESTGAQVGTH